MKSWRDEGGSPIWRFRFLLLCAVVAASLWWVRAATAFIGPVPDQVIAEGGQTQPISLDVSSQTVAMEGDSSDPLLVPRTNIVFSGSGPKRTVIITAAPNRFGYATITLKASESDSSALTSFLVTVNASVQISQVHGQSIVTWTATNAIPQEAADVGGPWNDVGLSSPYTISGTGPQYFRLRAQ